MQRAGTSRGATALFLLLVGAGLSVLLLRPVCEIAFAHLGHGQPSAACCESAEDGTLLDLAGLATPGPGGKHLAVRMPSRSDASIAALTAVLFASPVLPARSYYTRSSRILR